MKSYIEIGLSEYGNDAWAPDYVEISKLIPGDHGFLFDFIDYDFTVPEKELEKYLSCLDDETPPDENLLRTVIGEIENAHPYFHICPGNAASLLNRIFAGYLATKYAHKGMDWLKRAFILICVSRYSPYTDFDEMYSRRLDVGDRHILSCLRDMQKQLRRWLFMVLDDTNPELREYSTERRSMLYGYFYGENSVLTIKTEIRPTMSERMRRASLQYELDSLDEDGDSKKDRNKKAPKTSDELLEEAYNSLDLIMDFTPEGSLPKSVRKMLSGIGESKKEKEQKKILGIDDGQRVPEETGMIVHMIDGFNDILGFEVYGMINAGTRIRRCRNCGRYFVPRAENDELCSRLISGTNMTCCDKILTSVLEDKAELKAFLSNEYNKASNRIDGLVRRGTETREFLLEWRKEAKRRKKLAEEGKMDPYEYSEWLGNR